MLNDSRSNIFPIVGFYTHTFFNLVDQLSIDVISNQNKLSRLLFAEYDS